MTITKEQPVIFLKGDRHYRPTKCVQGQMPKTVGFPDLLFVL